MSAARGEYMVVQARSALGRGDLRVAESLARQALHHVARHPELAVNAVLVAGEAARYRNDFTTGHRCAREACLAAARTDDLRARLVAGAFLEHVRESSAEVGLDVMRRSLDLAAVAQEHQLHREELAAQARVSVSAFKAGREVEARAAVHRMRHLTARSNMSTEAHALYGLCAGLVELHYGAPEEADRLLRESRRLLPDRVDWQVLHGFPAAHLELKAGSASTGYRLLADAIDYATKFGFTQTASAGERFLRIYR